MSLVYRKRANAASLTRWAYDYWGEVAPFARRAERWQLKVPLVVLKSIEWGIYRWYKTPVRRFYGVRGNELIYMITRRCNERCAKCGIWKAPETSADRLPIERFLECLNRLHENLYQVTITGGEPLLFTDDVLRIGKEARKLGVPMLTITNGVLLTEGFLLQYGELGHELVLSLDTVEPSQWESFRGANTWSRVFGNLELAGRILGARFHVQSVMAIESRRAVQGVAEFCRERGIVHTIQPYLDFGGTWHGTTTFQNDDVPCAARKNICVLPDGGVVKCFDYRRIPEAREPLGNITQEDIITILCKRRATEVSRIMKNCSHPCKQMSCNLPTVLNGSSR